MFNLFKRTKLESWERAFLISALSQLPAPYNMLAQQVSAGLIRCVHLNRGYLPNYVTFAFNPDVYDQFANRKGLNIVIRNVVVNNQKDGRSLSVSIHTAYNVLIGYCIDNHEGKYIFDCATIDTRNVRYEDEADETAETIYNKLSQAEQQGVSKHDIYEVVLEGKTYYHLRPLEDGDFIGMDDAGNIYTVTHDPYAITPASRDILL